MKQGKCERKTAMTLRLEGAELIEVTPAEALKAVEWLLAARPRPSMIPEGLCWAVAQAVDTFVWGICTTEAWHWATHDADHEVRPASPKTLLEVRAFSADAEMLIWRNENGFAGRILRDVVQNQEDAVINSEVSSSAKAAKLPIDRLSYFLPVPDEDGQLTGRVSSTADPRFLRREEGNGRTTVTPGVAGISFRKYLEQCQETGMLRIAATRFHSVFDK
jgi:hypothetical protein